jgi:transposase InsO family protein
MVAHQDLADPRATTHGRYTAQRHEYELYLAVENIDHSRTKTKSPQTNGICERFHKTALNEFYSVAFRKKAECPWFLRTWRGGGTGA